MERWAGRVALVTGASVGIGASLAERLVKQGMKVVGCARRVENIQALSEKLKSESGELHAIKCDLKNEAEIINMFSEIKQKYGGVDVCVNNAGLSHSEISLIDGKTDFWRNMLDINVMALCICTRESIQSMKSRGINDGHIIHINSMSGHRVVSGPAGFYAASKHAVTALTEGLRNELRMMKSGIRITAVSPGLVETEFMAHSQGEEAAKTLYSKFKCLQPDDVVDSVVYALSAPPHVQVHDVLMRPTEQGF